MTEQFTREERELAKEIEWALFKHKNYAIINLSTRVYCLTARELLKSHFLAKHVTSLKIEEKEASGTEDESRNLVHGQNKSSASVLPSGKTIFDLNSQSFIHHEDDRWIKTKEVFGMVEWLKQYHNKEIRGYEKTMDKFLVQKDYQRINGKRLIHIRCLSKLDEGVKGIKDVNDKKEL